jgi:hypothetical protein
VNGAPTAWRNDATQAFIASCAHGVQLWTRKLLGDKATTASGRLEDRGDALQREEKEAREARNPSMNGYQMPS